MQKANSRATAEGRRTGAVLPYPTLYLTMQGRFSSSKSYCRKNLDQSLGGRPGIVEISFELRIALAIVIVNFTRSHPGLKAKKMIEHMTIMLANGSVVGLRSQGRETFSIQFEQQGQSLPQDIFSCSCKRNHDQPSLSPINGILVRTMKRLIALVMRTVQARAKSSP